MEQNNNLQRNNIILPSLTDNEKLLQYHISTKELGRGAFSKVFAAIYKPTTRKLAMKVVPLENLGDDVVRLAVNEVSLLQKIDSPHVIKLFDSFTANNILHVALELIDGNDLDKRIQIMRDRGSLYSERSVWYKFHQICAGLKDLHDQRILHRDLKPANIFITSKYQVKIGDFGLSRFCSETDSVNSEVGTEYYMSPERNSGGAYHFQSDIWSLGCVLYEICTYRSPFSGETTNVYSLHKKIENRDIVPFPMNVYSEHLIYFTYACLNTKSEERPTATECYNASYAMFAHFETMFAKYKAANPKPLINQKID